MFIIKKNLIFASLRQITNTVKFNLLSETASAIVTASWTKIWSKMYKCKCWINCVWAWFFSLSFPLYSTVDESILPKWIIKNWNNSRIKKTNNNVNSILEAASLITWGHGTRTSYIRIHKNKLEHCISMTVQGHVGILIYESMQVIDLMKFNAPSGSFD